MAIYDLMMELCTLAAIFFYFWQWKESVMIYIDKYYIQPIIRKNEEDKLKESRLKKMTTIMHQHFIKSATIQSKVEV